MGGIRNSLGDSALGTGVRDLFGGSIGVRGIRNLLGWGLDKRDPRNSAGTWRLTKICLLGFDLGWLILSARIT